MNPFSIAEFPTIPRYFTALAEWLNCMIFILILREQRRLQGRKLAAVCALGLAILTAELMITEALPATLWLLGMAGAVCIMMGLLAACMDLRPVQVGYLLAFAFMWSELTASLAWQLYYYYAAYFVGDYHEPASWIIVLIVYAAEFFGVWWLSGKLLVNGKCRNVHRRELMAVAVVAVLFFAISNLSFLFPNTPFTSSYATEIFNIRTLVDLGGVAVLYALFLQQQETQARYELEAIHTVLQTQYGQYIQSRDSMELINRKYHDIKHQIAVLRAESDPQRRSEWLDTIERDIAVYDSQYQTGNAVLDTLLASKSMSCQENGIQMTCVADGTLLGFMDAMDICAVFGNALDNAIESVVEADDPEKRLIHLSVSKEKGFVLIRAENYYEGERHFDDGIPKSTKGDSAYHGFGVKSIRYTARKYGGDLSITAQDHWFDLKVLIPLKGETAYTGGDRQPAGAV